MAVEALVGNTQGVAELMTDVRDALPPYSTRELAEFGSTLQFSGLPAGVVEHLKLLILDGLGCCLFGTGLPWT